MTAMKEAFLQEGYVDPRKRLREIAVEAWSSSRGTTEGAREALFKGIRGDFSLLWELVARSRNYEADALIAEIAQEMRSKKAAEELRNRMDPPRAINVGSSASGHHGLGNHQNHARRAADSSSGGAGHHGDADQIGAAHPIWNKAWQSPQKAMASVAAVARLSLLDTFKINGRSIGDLTAAEANDWASSRTRDVRFVRLLTTGLPLDKPIRKFRTGDEATALYDKASREMRDAG